MTINLEKRVFIGIPVGNKIKAVFPQIKSTLQGNPKQIRWTTVKYIHLTLSFIGNIPEDYIPIIVDSLENNLTFKYFKISIEGTGIFPTPNSPKVIWLGINKGADRLAELHLEIEKSVRDIKENPRKEKFIPHISIARIRRIHGKIDVLPFLDCVYSPIELDVNSICLYESQLLPEGAQYKVLNEFPLN